MASSENPLSIGFVADTIYNSGMGGVVSAARFVDKLREQHDVVLVGADADGAGKVRSFYLPFHLIRDTGFLMARPDRATVARALEKVDVVHVQLPFLLGFAALAEARRVGKPVVAAFHVQPENVLHSVGLRVRRINEWLYRFWVERFYNRADVVLAPTDFAARKLREHGLTRPVVVLSNGVYPSARERPRFLRSGRDPSVFRVLMVGRLAKEKHQETLIEAVKRSRFRDRIELVIAGRGPREKEIRERASALPNARVGFVAQEDLWRLLDTSDLLVHCSEVELEGMAVMEAMSAGLPVLVAQGPETAAADFALDDRFRFPVLDAGALASKLDDLLVHPSLLRSAGEQYQRRARTLDIDRSIDRLLDVYRTLARPRRLRPRAPSQDLDALPPAG